MLEAVRRLRRFRRRTRRRVRLATARLAASRSFLQVAPRVMPRVDLTIHRLSGRRLLLGQALVPTLVLKTKGAKTSRLYETPLAFMRRRDGCFVVVGSNFGLPHHPAWTANLLAQPQSTVVFRGREVPVTAHLMSESEANAVWPRLLRMWPPFETYASRTERPFRIFALCPADSAQASCSPRPLAAADFATARRCSRRSC